MTPVQLATKIRAGFSTASAWRTSEAALTELLAQRDWHYEMRGLAVEKQAEAEARAEAFEQALRDILDLLPSGEYSRAVARIARAALAGREPQ